MIVVSHRGPVSFRRTSDGSFAARRGAGGVVSALAPLLAGRSDVTWVAAALSDDDRAAVASDSAHIPDLEVVLLALDREDHRTHSEIVANQWLWFWLHGLHDLVTEAVGHTPDTAAAWASYRRINAAFASAVDEHAAPGETVLVQDYQLLLVGTELRARRPDLRIAQFLHTPCSPAEQLPVLPPVARDDFVHALQAAPTGFHTHHWEHAARSCLVGAGAPTDHLFTATFGPDADDLAAVAARTETTAAGAELEDRVGGNAVIVRADRVELSKNIVRGFEAYDRFLELHEEWRGGVVFAAMLNPSRETIPAYRSYRDAVDATVARVNDRWGTDVWTPILLDTRDDFPRSIAALARADVLFVNPVRDGLNLVALEGPLVNERDAALCLSTEAGAYEYLGDAVIAMDPLDIDGMAHAIYEALTAPRAVRAANAERIRDQAVAHPADAWLGLLVDHAC